MVSAEKALKENRKRQKTLSKAQSSAVNTMEENHEESDRQMESPKAVGVVTVVNCEDSSNERVNGVEEDKREDSNKVNAAEDNRENLSKERVNDVDEDKHEDSSTERVASQHVNIVNDVEDRSEDLSKIRVEPTEEDKPKDLGPSSVPYQIKPLEIANLSQLKEPPSELRAELVEMRDNVVHRKYPRGGRYFDDPESRPVMADDEFLALNGRKKLKKCLLCGNRDHNAKNCKQVVDCFICYSRGHLEHECRKKQIDKDESATVCLKCGGFGHDMFSCSNTYDLDDLKQIQCSVCMGFGHLSCADYMVEECQQVSCYKCGELGHIGSDCKKLLESFSTVTPRLFCFRCRRKGHHSRECSKRNKARDADSASESIIPNLAPIRSNDVVPSLNDQPKSG